MYSREKPLKFVPCSYCGRGSCDAGRLSRSAVSCRSILSRRACASRGDGKPPLAAPSRRIRRTFCLTL